MSSIARTHKFSGKYPHYSQKRETRTIQISLSEGGELNCILHVLHASKFLKSLEDATFVKTFGKVVGQSTLAQ